MMIECVVIVNKLPFRLTRNGSLNFRSYNQPKPNILILMVSVVAIYRLFFPSGFIFLPICDLNFWRFKYI